MYDVVVVGAGPAGSAAARLLSGKGARVLLVERKELPRYKSCSGVLIGRSLQLVMQHFGTEIPRSVQCTPIASKGMVFVNDQGFERRFEQDGLNVWRSGFDGWLVQRAQDAGTEVLDRTRAIGITECDDHAEVLLRSPGHSDWSAPARHVVVCEGAAGSLRHKIAGAAPSLVVTYQTYNIGTIAIDPAYFYAYLQPEFSRYDAWLNVKDDLVVYGVAVHDLREAPRYHERFGRFLEREAGMRLAKALGVDRWVMPRVQPGCPLELGRGHVLFCGEAAGFLNPMGEGISSAIDSGARAARSICAHLGNPDAAREEYRKQTRFMHAHMQRQWHGVAGMASTFAEMHMPW